MLSAETDGFLQGQDNTVYLAFNRVLNAIYKIEKFPYMDEPKAELLHTIKNFNLKKSTNQVKNLVLDFFPARYFALKDNTK